jgi:propionate catabolism operon transcriptional regulator
MPAALQSRLLRVLQEREVMKLGSGRATPIDVRVIAATHRNLRELVKRGTFRADLYFRLNLLQIELPPLRERRSDIPGLAQHLLARSAAVPPASHRHEAHSGVPLAALRALHMARNVRELENLVARAAIYLSHGSGGAREDLQAMFPEFGEMQSLPVAAGRHKVTDAPSGTVTRDDILRVLQTNGGNRAAASRTLGIGRTTLWRLMKE